MPDLRIQRVLTHAAHALAAQRLHSTICTLGGNDCGDHDIIASCSSDKRAMVFVARLSDRYNRHSPEDFIAWTRVFLQLPPLIRLGNAARVDTFDYAMETCLGAHAQGSDAKSDLYGSHDNGNCAPTAFGKHTGHTLLKWVLNRFANNVPGVHCVVEPKTHQVLNNQFTKEQCQRLFPKAPSQARIKQIQELVDELDTTQTFPTTVVATLSQNQRTEHLK